MADGRGLLHGYLGGGDMPLGMTIVMGLTIAGILALFIVWHELDRVERIVEEAERRRLGLSRPIRGGDRDA